MCPRVLKLGETYTFVAVTGILLEVVAQRNHEKPQKKPHQFKSTYGVFIWNYVNTAVTSPCLCLEWFLRTIS